MANVLKKQRSESFKVLQGKLATDRVMGLLAEKIVGMLLSDSRKEQTFAINTIIDLLFKQTASGVTHDSIHKLTFDLSNRLQNLEKAQGILASNEAVEEVFGNDEESEEEDSH